MIICNGVLSYRDNSGEMLFDKIGRPLPKSEEWTSGVACLVRTSSDDRQGRYKDGVFHKVSMTIYTETRLPLTAERIRVVRDENDDLGEHAIVSMEWLAHVGCMKIFVA